MHDRLLDFSKVPDVLQATTPDTLLIVYRGRPDADADAWLDAISETVLIRTARAAARAQNSQRTSTE